MPRDRRRGIGCWLVAAVLAVAAIFGWNQLSRLMREHPERFPWTKLSLDHPIGPFTGMKLAALADDRQRCLALLDSAGLAERPFVQPPPADDRCRVEDGVWLEPVNPRSVAYSPKALATSCPVAGALHLWERDVLQPSARRHFGRRVVRIDHAGSYNCRRLYGRDEGPCSEHATADAIDILAFRLDDGRVISVLRDWRGSPAEAAFLREARDGACRLYSTVLSPDYNQAHSDHLHLDQAERGATGWRMCR